jgi:hypothetical protein
MSRKPVHYTNYQEHHSQRQFLVFYFYAAAPAEHFQRLLSEAHIPFERGSGKDLVRRHLFGIHKSYEADAKRLNDEVMAIHRRPFIADRQFRIWLLILTGAVVALGIAGYLLNTLR